VGYLTHIADTAAIATGGCGRRFFLLSEIPGIPPSVSDGRIKTKRS
jgi:hypothetical protein